MSDSLRTTQLEAVLQEIIPLVKQQGDRLSNVEQQLANLLQNLLPLCTSVETNTNHVSMVNVILDAMIQLALTPEQKQSFVTHLQKYAEAFQQQPPLRQWSESAVHHVSELLAVPSDEPPKPKFYVIPGGKSDS